MLTQRPIVYLAAAGLLVGLLLAGDSVDLVLFIGFGAFILMMHIGPHGQGHTAVASSKDEVVGK